MLWFIGTAGIILNLLSATGAGAGLVMGGVFFLIGFGERKHSSRTLGRTLLSKDALMVLGTLSVVLMYFLICFWNLQMMGNMSFPGMLGFSANEVSGKRMLLAGILQLVWTVVSLYWLLPKVFDFGGLGLRSQVIALGAAGCSLTYGVIKIC